ncbi:hypothetical protein, partial [Methylobacterium sp. E-046]|uniref:hypothetical protein n=1 Tax=Methylobacterium sp. E-046 TaxID=2836576 RepID=UPI001FB90209
MSSLNPFRRQQPDRPTLRQRAADLTAGLARVVRKPATATPAGEPDEATDGIEEFAQLDFRAYDLDSPLRTPQQWAARFAAHAMSMHVADRTLRMSKPEMIAFIRESGERDGDLPGIMFQALDGAQGTFEGWGKLLNVARSRYVVAASAERVEHAAQKPKGEALIKDPEAPSASEAEPAQTFADQVTRAGLTGDVLAASGIDHRDGTVSYADATGKIVRRPMAHWLGFTTQQMHGRIQSEMGRRRMAEANHLPA